MVTMVNYKYLNLRIYKWINLNIRENNELIKSLYV